MTAVMPYALLAAFLIGIAVLCIPEARRGAAEWFGEKGTDDTDD